MTNLKNNMKSLKNILTKEILEKEYKIHGSMKKTAKALNVNLESIFKYIKLYNIDHKEKNAKIYTCNDNFFSQDNEQSFYWAGFLAADGCLSKRKYSKIIKLTLSSKDLSHLQKFKQDINSNNIINIYQKKPSGLVKNTHEICNLSIVSNKIFDDLKRFNVIPNKTKTYTFPEWLISHSLVHHFMRGYFDGDGCISYIINKSIKGKFNIIGTFDFIETYQKILIQSKVVNNVKINKIKNNYSLDYCGNQNISRIYNFLYKNTTICLDRKKDKFLKILTQKVIAE